MIAVALKNQTLGIAHQTNGEVHVLARKYVAKWYNGANNVVMVVTYKRSRKIGKGSREALSTRLASSRLEFSQCRGVVCFDKDKCFTCSREHESILVH